MGKIYIESSFLADPPKPAPVPETKPVVQEQKPKQPEPVKPVETKP